MNSTLLNKIHGNFYFVVGATLKILNIDKIVRSNMRALRFILSKKIPLWKIKLEEVSINQDMCEIYDMISVVFLECRVKEQ